MTTPRKGVETVSSSSFVCEGLAMHNPCLRPRLEGLDTQTMCCVVFFSDVSLGSPLTPGLHT